MTTSLASNDVTAVGISPMDFTIFYTAARLKRLRDETLPAGTLKRKKQEIGGELWPRLVDISDIYEILLTLKMQLPTTLFMACLHMFTFEMNYNCDRLVSLPALVETCRIPDFVRNYMIYGDQL